MCITINTLESCLDIPDGMTREEIRLATPDDEHLGMLSEYIMHSWQSTKDEVLKELQLYWSFRDEIAIID